MSGDTRDTDPTCNRRLPLYISQLRLPEHEPAAAVLLPIATSCGLYTKHALLLGSSFSQFTAGSLQNATRI